MSQLSAQQVRELDPFAILAVLGKRVLYPGGRESAEWLLEWAVLKPGERVLDIGCGVGTTAIRMARETSADVVAADISPLMRERARRNVARSGIDGVRVEAANILALPYDDNSFDCVVAEAVTIFVDRDRAAKELARVCKPGGRVLATEFCWRRSPAPEARELFLGRVCPGMQVDIVQECLSIYFRAGLTDIQTASGPFAVMTARGFLSDEGPSARRRGDGAGDDTADLSAQDGLADATDGPRRSLPRIHRRWCAQAITERRPEPVR